MRTIQQNVIVHNWVERFSNGLTSSVTVQQNWPVHKPVKVLNRFGTYMWPDLGKSNILHILSNLRFCYNYLASIIIIWITSVLYKYKHLQFYHQWATAFCNAAITIANIEGGKLACAHTQNRTFFKNFLQIQSHNYYNNKCVLKSYSTLFTFPDHFSQ